MKKPRIFFDTNVCNDIAYRNLNREWRIVSKYISRHYRYAISPLTMLELMIKIGRGHERYFEKNRRALNVMYGSRSERTFLPFPGQFVLENVLGDKKTSLARFGPSDFAAWTRAILRARNMADLRQGRVDLGHPRYIFEFRFATVERQQQAGKDAHRQILERIRAQRLLPPRSMAWAASILRHLSRPIVRDDCQKIATALDAAYRFNEYLCILAKNNSYSYDFARHDSDWIDLQQLYYLSHDSVIFVTNDNDLIRETLSSHQHSRIMRFRELVQLAESTTRSQ